MTRNKYLEATPHVGLDHAALTLGILEKDLYRIIKNNKIQVVRDYSGKPAITKNDIKVLSRVDIIAKLRAKRFQESNKHFNSIERPGAFIELEERYSEIIIFLETKIGRLEEIFNTLYLKINRSEEESALLAAMMLYSKCIALSKAVITLLKSKHWHIGSIIREIMECHSLALYFYQNKDDKEIQEEIIDWFRIEKSPKMIKVRHKSAEYRSKMFKDTSVQYHFDFETDLYNRKSKLVHSTFLAIAETAEFNGLAGTMPTKLNLGKDYRLVNLVDIAEMACGSIQPIFSTFAALIHLAGLDQKELFNEIRIIDSEFAEIYSKRT